MNIILNSDVLNRVAIGLQTYVTLKAMQWFENFSCFVSKVGL